MPGTDLLYYPATPSAVPYAVLKHAMLLRYAPTSRKEENVTRQVRYSCVVYGQVGSKPHAVVACGDDRKITEFRGTGIIAL
eukprot:308305-Rhodomonas_salina.2